MAVVFMAAVEVDFMGAVEAGSTAVARFAVAADSLEDTAAAASARDLLAEARTEAAHPWAAGALHLADPGDSDAASMLEVAAMAAAEDTGLAMRSRTATGILLAPREAPRMQEVQRDFAMPQLRMADGTRLKARARV